MFRPGYGIMAPVFKQLGSTVYRINSALASLALLAGLSVASISTADQDIADRIKKVGTICLQGDTCADASAAPVTVASSGGGDVESNYNKSCATCHNAGVAGAPKIGDTEAWAERLEKGMDVLYASAINGMPPAMPAKGMCFSCSDDDLRALVDYMLEGAE